MMAFFFCSRQKAQKITELNTVFFIRLHLSCDSEVNTIGKVSVQSWRHFGLNPCLARLREEKERLFFFFAEQVTVHGMIMVRNKVSKPYATKWTWVPEVKCSLEALNVLRYSTNFFSVSYSFLFVLFRDMILAVDSWLRDQHQLEKTCGQLDGIFTQNSNDLRQGLGSVRFTLEDNPLFQGGIQPEEDKVKLGFNNPLFVSFAKENHWLHPSPGLGTNILKNAQEHAHYKLMNNTDTLMHRTRWKTANSDTEFQTMSTMQHASFGSEEYTFNNKWTHHSQ